MSRRDLKSGGSLTNSSSLDRTKVYTYDSNGNLVEVNGTTVVLGDNDIAFSGSKSNLRRMADMERNISILATRLIDGSSYTITNTSDVDYSGNFEVSGNFGTQFVEKLEDVVGAMFSTSHTGDITITYDDANSKIVFNTFSGEFADLANIPTTLSGYGITDAYTQSQIDSTISTLVLKSGDTMSGNLNMNSNSVTNLAAPVNSTDAVNKSYVDSQVSSVSGDLANVAEYTSWFFSDGTNLSEIGDGSTLVINPGNNISIAYNATSDEYTISSTDTDTNNYVTGLSFNTSDGVLTATRSGLSDLTVDLDGRYQPKVTISGTAPTSPSAGDLWYDNNTDLKIFIYTGSEWVDTVPTAQNNYLTSLSFNSGDGVLTATREGLTDVTVDLDGRYISSETVTSLSLSTNTLSYVDENGTTTNIDLSLYLDDTNLARLVSGTVNGTTGIATFTRDDATTFTVDFSALFDDTNLTRIDSGSFNTSTGDLTLTRTDATTAATISLDGRYIQTDAAALWTILDESDNTYPITYTDSLKITGGFSITTAFTGDDVLSIAVDTTDLDGRYRLIDDDVYTSSAAFNTSDGVITFTRNDTTTYSVDIDGRYIQTDAAALWTILDESDNTYPITYTDSLKITGGFSITTAFTGDDVLSIAVDTTDLDGRYLLIDDDVYTSSAAFTNGVITFTRNDTTTYSVDIDGRYIQQSATALWTILDENDSSYPITYADSLKITGGFSITTAFTGDDVLSIAVDTTDLDGRYRLIDDDVYTSSASFNTNNGVITFTRNDASTYTVDIDGRYIETSAAALWTIVDESDNTYPITYTDSLKITGGNGINTAFTGDDVLTISVNTADLDSSYDNYGSWTISDGTASEAINSNDTLTITGSGSTTTSYNSATNTLTISSTGTTYTAGTGIDITGTTISHDDTSTVTDLIASGRTYVTGLEFDAFGHIVSYTTGTESVTNSNYYPTALSFNSSTGDLTIAVTGSSDITASLDGRYLTSYTETSTLADVTSRGASTTTAVTFGDVSVNGNLNVLGATTTVNQTTLSVNDSKIFLADGNPSDAIDVGVIFEYNDGTNDQSAGLFRDATDGSFTFMSTYTPTVGSVINTADASYALGDVKAANFTGNVAWSNLTNVPDPVITVTLTGDVEGTANATMTDLGSATISVAASVPATTNLTLASLSVTNLTVTGNQTVNNQSTLTSDDPLFILNSSQSGEPDIGMVGAYNDGTAQYSGIFRDATDNKWKVFDGYTPTLTGNTPSINVSDASFSYATIVAGTFEGSLDWSNVTNKPDPQVTVTLTGDVTGSASTTLTDLASGTVSISTGVSSSADLNVNSLTTTTNLIVGGNLTVSGTTTTVNTEEINLADNIVVLNSNATGSASQDAGIEINRGDDTNVSLLWDETNNRWTVGSQTFVASTFIGNLTGNASTATSAGKWTTPRTITLGGDLTGNVNIDGSTNVTLTATVAANSVALGTDTTGNYMSGVTAGSGISIAHTPAEGSTATISHADTSSVANLSSDNANGVVIQDVAITFDTYGHVQTASVTTVDLDSRYLQSETDTLNTVTTRGNTTTNGISVGSVTLGSVVHDDASATIATTTQTAITLYAASAYGAKLVVRARDTVSGAIHMTELLIANTTSSAVATEYGSVFTGSALATFDVDISGGNVRLLVTGASSNSTQYNISITRM